MNLLFEAALELQQFMEAKKWPFCFIGGLAVLRWGEVRMTQDIDVCLLSGFGNEDLYIREVLRKFQSRITDAFNFARKNRVLLITTSNDVAADISLSGLPFEEQMIKRASLFEYAPGCRLMTCSAEDLVVLKSFAERPKDWIDVEGIVIRQSHGLDQRYIIEQLTPLCEIKQAPEIIEKYKALISQI